MPKIFPIPDLTCSFDLGPPEHFNRMPLHPVARGHGKRQPAPEIV